ncbi:MAG: hypothetical protein KJ601_02390 [Nanoarchaeota archaeon]|nr:hypothetical protein [Nanoarchaeota archaeon]
MKKSQITVFLILFIVMLILVGFLFYVRSKVTSAGVDKRVEKAYDDFMQRTSLTEYVQSCLELAAKGSILLAGKQGGWLYRDQVDSGLIFTGYGPSFLPLNISGTEYRAYYVSTKQYDGLSDFYVSTPGYPYSKNQSLVPSIPAGTPALKVSKTDGRAVVFSGTNKMPSLCDQSAKSPNVATSEIVRRSCDPATYGTDNLQVRLNQYLVKSVNSCIDFSSFKAELGYNITQGEIRSNVTFGEDDITFQLSYPLIISFKGKPPITKVSKFNYDLDVRFKKIFEVFWHTVAEDKVNIFYNITNISELKTCCTFNISSMERDICNVSCSDGNISATRINQPCAGMPSCPASAGYSYVINITDFKSIVDGEPISFYFGLQNRRPALDLIDLKVTRDYDYYHYLDDAYGVDPYALYNPILETDAGLIAQYNLIVSRGDKIHIIPRGIDPDEDSLTYTYSGWKTDRPFYDACPQVEFDTDWPSASGNIWEQSLAYTQGILQTDGLTRITSKDANLTTVLEDVGQHCLVVNITDPEGLSDYQRILIDVK